MGSFTIFVLAQISFSNSFGSSRFKTVLTPSFIKELKPRNYSKFHASVLEIFPNLTSSLTQASYLLVCLTWVSNVFLDPHVFRFQNVCMSFFHVQNLIKFYGSSKLKTFLFPLHSSELEIFSTILFLVGKNTRMFPCPLSTYGLSPSFSMMSPTKRVPNRRSVKQVSNFWGQ